jgi:precorrin-3B synthase
MRLGENFCPGILHAVPAKDGLLIRIRVPGGSLSADQLTAVAAAAEAFADGEIEITSRANLQLRGIDQKSLPHLVSALTQAGFLPSERHDRVRNIVTSPLAGIDPHELLDTRTLIQTLDERLIAEDVLLNLHPKFSFGIYGGGRQFTREIDDLSLHAKSAGQLHFYFGGTDTNFAVSAEHAVTCLLIAAETIVALALQYGTVARAKKIVSLPESLERILTNLTDLLTPSSLAAPLREVEEDPIGTSPAMAAGRLNVVPCIPLGRVSASQARHIAALATEFTADLRLSPWRGVVLGDVPQTSIAAITDRLESIGLSLNNRNGFQGIAACAGSTGCDSSLGDVRQDASTLARNLAGFGSVENWTVHFSGCEKQCAMRHAATAEFVATSAGYDLRLKGQPTISGMTADAAIHAALNAHHVLRAGVISR